VDMDSNARGQQERDDGSDDGHVEDLLDSYFVDRLRFLSNRAQRLQRLQQHFRESGEGMIGMEGIDRGERNHEYTHGGDCLVSLVCVDGSAEADAALAFALRHCPQEGSLILAHGIRVPLTTTDMIHNARRNGPLFGEDDETDAKHRATERHYLQQCQDAHRHCVIKHFTFTTQGGFGRAICSFADQIDASSVVIGQRHPRPLLGASSTAVMRYCQRPMVLVPRGRRTAREGGKKAWRED